MHTTDATQPFRDWTILQAPTRWERRRTVRLEEYTANLPSAFLGVAVAAMAVAMVLLLAGKTPESLFIALWTAPYLVLGLCNKLFKVSKLKQEYRGKVGGVLDTAAADRRRLPSVPSGERRTNL